MVQLKLRRLITRGQRYSSSSSSSSWLVLSVSANSGMGLVWRRLNNQCVLQCIFGLSTLLAQARESNVLLYLAGPQQKLRGWAGVFTREEGADACKGRTARCQTVNKFIFSFGSLPQTLESQQGSLVCRVLRSFYHNCMCLYGLELGIWGDKLRELYSSPYPLQTTEPRWMKFDSQRFI